ncbi:uncharacterized protein BO96DRAFT_345958 [Aspergillus niger CBS 101883]|uniref:uncharacterized protein n=1 Tax=Aspergillus lacticoffeatus (strain CBS 101883) TaxID=1450533 RepID=UPI000D7F0A32|nr:uncharacterized protein BO96DRAFT_345958 [Aspergillus niger CBS 101883]PYH53174.1 hypothetical protein BO96DRAFT_345958 [Aspergillus niger CBS 101883]
MLRGKRRYHEPCEQISQHELIILERTKCVSFQIRLHQRVVVLNNPGTSMIAATLRQSTTIQSMLKVVLRLAVLLVSFDHNDVISYLTTD